MATTFDAHKNFAVSSVLTPPSPATTGVSLTLSAGDGVKMPAAPFNATVWPTYSQPTTLNAEIVRVTAVVGDTLTIQRTQEGTAARTILVGDQIAAGITVKTVVDLEAAINSFSSGPITLTGPLVLGTDPGGAQLLRVGGTSHFSGLGTFDNGITVSAGTLLIGSKQAGVNSLTLDSASGSQTHFYGLTDSRYKISSNGSGDFGWTGYDKGAIGLGSLGAYSGISGGGGTINSNETALYFFTGVGAATPTMTLRASGLLTVSNGLTVTLGGIRQNDGNNSIDNAGLYTGSYQGAVKFRSYGANGFEYQDGGGTARFTISTAGAVGVTNTLTVSAGGLNITGATAFQGGNNSFAGQIYISAGGLNVGGASGGAVQRGIALANVSIDANATTQVDGMYIGITTPNIAFTTPLVTAFNFGGIAKGAAHTITTAVGVQITTGVIGTNNIGLYLQSGAAPTGNWSLYSQSALASWFAGAVTVAAAGLTLGANAGASADAGLTLNSAVAAQASIFLQAAGVAKWQVLRQATSHDLNFYNSVTARNEFVIASATGAATIASGLTITAGGLTVTAGGLTVSAGGASIVSTATSGTAFIATHGGSGASLKLVITSPTNANVVADANSFIASGFGNIALQVTTSSVAANATTAITGSTTISNGLTVSAGGGNIGGGLSAYQVGQGSFNALLATSAAQFEIASNSMVAIGDSSTNAANPHITFYRTSAGFRTGSAFRQWWSTSSGPFKWQAGTQNAAYGSETYTDLMSLTNTGALTISNGLTVTAGGITVSAGGASITGNFNVSGEIRNANAADGSPYTQTRITVYRDAGNWGYLAYGADAQLRIVYSSASSAASLLFGTTSAFDNTGAFTQRASLTAAGVLTVAGGLTVSAGGATITGATQVNGNFGIGAAPSANQSVGITQNVSDAVNAFGIWTNQTLTLTANNGAAWGYAPSNTVATGTFTGLTYKGIALSAPSKTGTGTIANAYALYIDAPTIGTNNWAVFVSSGSSFFGNAVTINAGGLSVSAGGASITGLVTSTVGFNTTGTFNASTWLQVAGGRSFRWTLNNDATFRLQSSPDGFTTADGTPIIFGVNAIGFYGTAPVAKQTVTGSKGANAALTSLMAALAAMGLVTDSTT